MASPKPGYDKDLFVLPFDHRGSFESGLLGIKGRPPTSEELERLRAFKRVIYEGFVMALAGGVPADTSAILVDQKYGADILADARQRAIVTCAPVEKSGQDEFDFEYGDEFGARLDEAAPTFAKALVRYNPEGDRQVNETQRRRLKSLSDYAHSRGYRFMFELLVPATTDQLRAVEQDKHSYDLRLRPQLTVQAIDQLQQAGVEPDVWKLEGMDEPDAAIRVVAQARTGARDDVGIIVLGRGEDEARVRGWLTVGARTDGVIGFAVGRTVFWQPLIDFKDGATTREQASERIAATYRRLYDLFAESRKGVAQTPGV